MTACGVFFLLVFLLGSLTSPSTYATGISLSGYLDPKEGSWNTMLEYEQTYQLSNQHTVTGALELTQGYPEDGNLSFGPLEWQCQSAWGLLTLGYNAPYWKSPDLFGSVEGDEYLLDTLALTLEAPKYTLLVAEEIPLDQDLSGRVVHLHAKSPRSGVMYWVSAFDSEHRWVVDKAGKGELFRRKGTMLGLEGMVQSAFWQGRLFWAHSFDAHESFEGVAKRSATNLISTATFSAGNIDTEIRISRTEPDFFAPLAGGEGFPQDRQGIFLSWKTKLRSFDFLLNLSYHERLTTDRSYTRASFEVGDSNGPISVEAELRLAPVPNFLFSASHSSWFTDWNFARSQLRAGYDGGEHFISSTLSPDTKQVRVEYRYSADGDLRFIFKHDFLRQEDYLYASVGAKFQFGEFEVSFGKYDQGQLGRGFGGEPSLRVAWSTEF